MLSVWCMGSFSDQKVGGLSVYWPDAADYKMHRPFYRALEHSRATHRDEFPALLERVTRLTIVGAGEHLALEPATDGRLRLHGTFGDDRGGVFLAGDEAWVVGLEGRIELPREIDVRLRTGVRDLDAAIRELCGIAGDDAKDGLLGLGPPRVHDVPSLVNALI